MYPIWIIFGQIQAFNGVPQCAHHSGTTVPEETMARGAEQSQASNPDIIPTFGRLAAHTNIEIFIPPGAESAGTVVIGIFNHQG